ncbi:DUF397 domain-containing protein [Nocardiopsis alkaliphila]|uniref:DUF397 domain-containing protein n=1 Tax=Nocardiopsis alkaliphila TaxID=225762 RepID=UPI000688FD70|nr:DUF397 domain-containing protein [Nocardiopsis alkaliphila]
MTGWTKSSYSSTGATCVQVRSVSASLTEIGDTKNPHGPTLTVPNSDWVHLLDQIISGRTDYRRLFPCFLPDGGFTLTDTTNPFSPTLTYTKAEWEAFETGVRNGQLRTPHPEGTLVG